MAAKRISGSDLSRRLLGSLREEVQAFVNRHGKAPTLTVFLLTPTGPSSIYVTKKRQAAQAIGMNICIEHLQQTMSEADLVARVRHRASDPSVDGIIVQLPLPRQLNRRVVLDAVPPHKDVDGLSTHSLALLRSGLTSHAGLPRFVPCAPAAVLHVLKHAGVQVQGQRVTLLGRGMLVGDPLYALLRSCAPASLSIADANTPQDERTRMCQGSDIIISAVGIPNTVTPDMVHKDAIVVDVGTSRADYKHARREGGYRTVGDVSPAAYPLCAAYTPVPGGVGPVTVAMLLRNTLTAARCAMRDPI